MRLTAGLVLLVAVPALAGGAAPGPPGPGTPSGAAPAPTAGSRALTFSWTLYPAMWAELDLRMGTGSEAVAELTAEGGEVSWDLHTHPPDAPPSAFVTLERGVARRAVVRCAPAVAGWYSYLVRNDAGAGPVRVTLELRLSGDARVAAVRP